MYPDLSLPPGFRMEASWARCFNAGKRRGRRDPDLRDVDDPVLPHRPRASGTDEVQEEDGCRAVPQVAEGKIADGVPVSAASARYRFDDAAKDIIADYTINQRRSLAEVQRRINRT